MGTDCSEVIEWITLSLDQRAFLYFRNRHESTFISCPYRKQPLSHLTIASIGHSLVQGHLRAEPENGGGTVG